MPKMAGLRIVNSDEPSRAQPRLTGRGIFLPKNHLHPLDTGTAKIRDHLERTCPGEIDSVYCESNSTGLTVVIGGETDGKFLLSDLRGTWHKDSLRKAPGWLMGAQDQADHTGSGRGRDMPAPGSLATLGPSHSHHRGFQPHTRQGSRWAVQDRRIQLAMAVIGVWLRVPIHYFQEPVSRPQMDDRLWQARM